MINRDEKEAVRLITIHLAEFYHIQDSFPLFKRIPQNKKSIA